VVARNPSRALLAPGKPQTVRTLKVYMAADWPAGLVKHVPLLCPDLETPPEGGMGLAGLRQQFIRLGTEHTHLGQPKRRSGSAADRRWNAQSIRSIGTRNACIRTWVQWADWLRLRHPDVGLVREIEPGMALEWLRELQARGVSDSTVRQYRSRLRKAALRAEARGWCPAKRIAGRLGELSLEPRRLDTRRRGGAYSNVEAKRLLERVARDDAAVGVALRAKLACGLRASELFCLRRDQVMQGAQVGRMRLDPSQTKGGRPREVWVNPAGRTAFREALVASGWADRPFALEATPVASARRAWRVVRRGCRELGIRCRGLHGLRATAARRWMAAARMHAKRQGLGAEAAALEVSVRMGHGRPQVTAAYLAPGPGENGFGAAVQAVPERWRGREGELQALVATGRELARVLGLEPDRVLGISAADLRRALRTGCLTTSRGTSPLPLGIHRSVRRAIELTPGSRYPFRAYLEPGPARRLWPRTYASPRRRLQPGAVKGKARSGVAAVEGTGMPQSR